MSNLPNRFIARLIQYRSIIRKSIVLQKQNLINRERNDLRRSFQPFAILVPFCLHFHGFHPLRCFSPFLYIFPPASAFFSFPSFSLHPYVHASSPRRGSRGLFRGCRWLFVAVCVGDVSFPCEHIHRLPFSRYILPRSPFRPPCSFSFDSASRP